METMRHWTPASKSVKGFR